MLESLNVLDNFKCFIYIYISEFNVVILILLVSHGTLHLLCWEPVLSVSNIFPVDINQTSRHRPIYFLANENEAMSISICTLL